MAAYHTADVVAAMNLGMSAVESGKYRLTEIDSMAGDGDLGTSIVTGVQAIRPIMEGYQAAPIGPLFKQCGLVFNQAAPSTMGTLIGMAMMALGQRWQDAEELSEAQVVEAPRVLADAIARLGKAKQGDNTILDALYPFADALEKSFEQTGDLRKSFADARETAREAMEATAGMAAAVGRARWLGERATGVVDGGALLCVMVLDALGKEA